MTLFQLDDYLIHPALSGILSITFILGILHINFIINRILNSKVDFLISICSFYTLLGLISSMTVFIVLLGLVNNIFVIMIYYIICGFGLLSISNFVINTRTNTFRHHRITFIQNTNYFVYCLTIAILIFYFLLSITPVTDADSLDYHIGFPLEIVRKGELYFKLDWKHSRVIGLGEFINLIGLVIRTDNIGASLNFISLCILLLVTYNFTSNKQINIYLTLLILSTPLLLQMIPNQKPQFYGACAIIIPILVILKNKTISSKYAFVIIASVFFAISLKYSFYVSGSVTLLFIIYTLKNKLPVNILYCLLLYLLFIFPLNYLKYIFFGDPISPMSSVFIDNGPVEHQFYSQFKAGKDGYGMPLGFFIPKNIGNLSTVSGIGILTLLGINKISHTTRNYFIISLILFITIFAIGQNVSRSYFEPLIILYIGIFISIKLKDMHFNFIKLIIYSQLLFILISTISGLYTLLPSLINNKYRDIVMTKTAHNYSVMKWADKKLPKDSCIISDFRSNALVPREFVAWNYTTLISNGYSNSKTFINCISYKEIFLVTGRAVDLSHSLIKYIIFPIYADNVFSMEFRNPLNKGTYAGYIYKIDKNKLYKDSSNI